MRSLVTHAVDHPVVPHVIRGAFWVVLLAVLVAHAPGLVPGADVGGLLVRLAIAGACAALFLSCFALFHDAAHGALGLPRALNEALLALLSVPLFMSTHGQRQLHMRHHARPLADDDVEGIGARLSPVKALAASPLLVGGVVVEGVRAVPAKLKRLVVLEWLAVASLALAAVTSPSSWLALYVAVAAVLQMSIGFWASHVPHNPPALVQAVARRLVVLRSPVVLSLVFHQEHHAHPRVPCADLAALA